ncbi:MAG: hypothetical protein AAB804_02190 [Patescibacteria group bacterium]
MAVQKILFPYLLSDIIRQNAETADTVVFFGTDFYNLPYGSDHTVFIERTNQMLEYIRKHFPNSRLLYQAHPNETDEYTHLDLKDFSLGERVIAEAFLYQNASEISFVLSACSGASASAYAMGFNAAVCIDLLHGALPEEAIIGYRSYFAGIPEGFFIRSFQEPVPVREPVSKQQEAYSIARIKEAVGTTGKLWVLTSSPGLAVQAALVLKYAREHNPALKAGMLKIGGRRWEVAPIMSKLEEGFEEVIHVRDRRILYSARPQRLLEAARTASRIKKLPIREGDVVVSFCNTLFEENCIIAYHKRKARIIGLIENRWYHFTFSDRGESLSASEFRASWGALAFSWVLEPLLGLYRTVTKEYKDGRVINFFRYRSSLESVYDTVFVLVPDARFSDAKITDEAYTRR